MPVITTFIMECIYNVITNFTQINVTMNDIAILNTEI